MPKEADTNVPKTLEHAYPTLDEKTSKEIETLKSQVEELTKRGKELEEENGSLKKTLADIENEKKVALAEQVVDLKVSRGLLSEDKKEGELKELQALSTETLTVLHKELSNVKVKLSEDPKPLTSNTPDPTPPAEPSAEEKFNQEVVEMRMKLFGHEDDPMEHYKGLRDKGELW